ncbi:hypothetical protein WJX72_008186 [[Myrmecia] bisecta]|uniref:Uncharacterized protein n=1 Tax=[Myrmecia] bisecta TaxID=41462 RepID=A0AAW1Q6R3_9CHLO
MCAAYSFSEVGVDSCQAVQKAHPPPCLTLVEIRTTGPGAKQVVAWTFSNIICKVMQPRPQITHLLFPGPVTLRPPSQS